MFKKFQSFIFISFLSLSSYSQAKEYSVDELIQMTKKDNTKVRAKSENLFRAHQAIKVSIGRLIPRFNMTVVANVFSQDYTLAGSLLGFLFPSNWFQWKESKLFFEAEKRSYALLTANEINGVLSMAYRVNFIKSLHKMYSSYLTETSNLVEQIETLYRSGELTAEDVLEFKNLVIKIKIDQTSLTEELKRIRAELANGLSLPNTEWGSFDLKPIELPKLENTPEIKSDEFYEKVMAQSLELKSLEYLILASNYSIATRKFEFLTINSNPDSSLGFGYSNYINIGKSERRELDVKKEATVDTLHLALQDTVARYNSAIELYAQNQKGFENVQSIRGILQKKLESGEGFSFKEFTDEIDSAFAFHSRILDAQHKFLFANELLSRLLMSGPYYSDLLKLTPPESLNSSKLSIKQRWENRQIEKSIKNGELDLPK